MATTPLTGFNYKKEQQDLAAAAQRSAEAAEKLQRDAEYNLRRAQEDAATTAIAARGKAECLSEAGLQREAAERFKAEQTGLVKDVLRKKKQEATAATKKAERLESLAAMDDPGRADAIRAAEQAVVTRRGEWDTPTADAARLRSEADAKTLAANAIQDLDRAWTKDHAASTSSRALEG